MSPIDRTLALNITQRPDILHIGEIIPKGSRVLDLGCGNGELMGLLKQKGVRVQGIEKDESCVLKCMSQGLYVHHGDIDGGLSHHLDKSFDYVILNQTIQQTVQPGQILQETLRIGKNVIVVFPNFSHWMIRLSILCNGRTPVTKLMPYHWYDTPNLHFLSVLDFKDYCKINQIKTAGSAFFHKSRRIHAFANFRSSLALFILQE